MLYLQAGNDSLLDCMQCNFSNSSGKHGGKHGILQRKYSEEQPHRTPMHTVLLSSLLLHIATTYAQLPPPRALKQTWPITDSSIQNVTLDPLDPELEAELKTRSRELQVCLPSSYACTHD